MNPKDRIEIKGIIRNKVELIDFDLETGVIDISPDNTGVI